MTKAEKLKELKTRLEALQNPVGDISQFFINDELARITEQLKANPTMKALQKFSGDLQRLQTEISNIKASFNVAEIQTSIRQVQKELKQGQVNLLAEFENRLRQLPQIPDLTNNLQSLREEFDTRIKAIPVIEDLKPDLVNLQQQLQSIVETDIEQDKQDKDELDKTLAKLRIEIMNRIANIGGGSMNRQILFNSVDRLTKYTDINLKPGANITFTVANDDTNKRVNLTIAATGGSGSGITRSIQSISANQVLDSASTTDYVYLVSGTTTVTMPDATTNTDLYTIKNVGNGTVTINTTSSQTIDGALTQVMPIKFTSVDLISDGSNWGIT